MKTISPAFLNHFHNPIYPVSSWGQAGLDSFWYSGQSSVLWAQDSGSQASAWGGDWSWAATRHYYQSLIAVDHVAKEQAFSEALLGLGHQIHLLQDTAVPAHVRNDAHPLSYNKKGSPHIETWASRNRNTIRQIAANTRRHARFVTARRCHFQRCQAGPHRPALRRRPIRRQQSVYQPLAGPGRIHQCQFLQRRHHFHRRPESRRSPCAPLSREGEHQPPILHRPRHASGNDYRQGPHRRHGLLDRKNR